MKNIQGYQTVFFIHTIQHFTNTHYLPKISMKLHKPNYFIHTDEVAVIVFMRLTNEQIIHITLPRNELLCQLFGGLR